MIPDDDELMRIALHQCKGDVWKAKARVARVLAYEAKYAPEAERMAKLNGFMRNEFSKFKCGLRRKAGQ